MKHGMKEELQERLSDTITKYKHDQSNKDKIFISIKERIKLTDLVKIFNGEVVVDTMSKRTLYFLSKGFYNELEINELKPELFFTDYEITEFESEPLDLEQKGENSNVIILNNVLPTVEDKQYICSSITYKELVSIFNRNLINYDSRIQRESRKKLIGDTIQERPKLYQKSINEMSKKMKIGKYIPTAISFAILSNGEEKWSYDKEKLQFIIEVDSKSIISIIDGLHRVSSILTSLSEVENEEEKEKLENQIMQVNIFIHEIRESAEYIYQEAQKNTISKVKQKALNTSDVTNKIIREINSFESESVNKLFNKIGMEYSDLKMGKYMIYADMISCIEYNFNKYDYKNNPKMQRKIRNFIIDLFNEIISEYDHIFKNIENYKEINALAYCHTLYGLIALGSQLFGLNRWEEELEYILENKINFDLNEEIWSKLNITKEKLRGKQRTDLYEYFKGLVGDFIEK